MNITKTMRELISAIIRTDAYKTSQYKQYPPNTRFISSYIEARGGKLAKESVFFGLQMYTQEYMLTPITAEDIDYAEMIITNAGLPFNREGWEYILKEHKGFMPVRIEAVQEGTVMPTGNVQVQIVNTDAKCAWVVSYIETALLRGVWYPSTVATKSREIKKHIANMFELTSDTPIEEAINFKLHDFGA